MIERTARFTHTHTEDRAHACQSRPWEGRETGKREKKALEQRNRVQIWLKALIQNSIGALNKNESRQHLANPSRV